MKKINGQVILERDEVGETPRINKALIASACRLFFAKRGMRFIAPREQYHNEAMAAMRAKARAR